MAVVVHKEVLKVEGREDVKALQAAVQQQEQALLSWIDTLKAAGVANYQLDASVRQSAEVLGSLRNQLLSAEQGLQKLGGGTGSLLQSVNTLAFSFDDAQQFSLGFATGMRAISNNIPGLVGAFTNLSQVGVEGLLTALSGPAGLALGLTLVGTLAVQLTNHWSGLQAVLGLGIPQPALQGPELLAENLKKASKEMDTLREKARLTLAESLRLKELEQSVPELKRQQADAQETAKLLEAPSKATAERGAGFKEAISQVGPDKALADLAAALEKTADETGRVANPFGGGGTAEEVAKALLLEASRGDEFARGQVTNAVGKDSTFGKAIGEKSPEGKLTAELNKQGQENEELARKEKEQQDAEDLKDQAARTDEDQKASDKRLEKLKKQRADRVKALAEGGIGAQILQGKDVTAEDVQKELKGAGVKDVTPELAEKYLKAVKKDVDEQADERATKEGITPEAARKGLLSDREDKFQKEMDAGVDAQKKEFQAKLKSYEDDHPEFESILAASSRAGFARGGVGGAQSDIIQQLQAAGLAGGFGARIFAKDQANDAYRDALNADFRGREKIHNLAVIPAHG
jgi:hypothetical protein